MTTRIELGTAPLAFPALLGPGKEIGICYQATGEQHDIKLGSSLDCNGDICLLLGQYDAYGKYMACGVQLTGKDGEC